MLATEFKSPPNRLARLFRRSRDTWKRRAAEKQRALKKMRITVRDLTASRDHWKAIARQQAQQIAVLRDELDHIPEAPPAGGC
jgi:arginyl-tRNA--protein-N-Asp/Glu arginylyltransferase